MKSTIDEHAQYVGTGANAAGPDVMDDWVPDPHSAQKPSKPQETVSPEDIDYAALADGQGAF